MFFQQILDKYSYSTLFGKQRWTSLPSFVNQNRPASYLLSSKYENHENPFIGQMDTDMLNPSNIVYLPTPQYTYRDIYDTQQKERYGNHYMTDKRMEELYEYIKLVENNDEYNALTFFETEEWIEGNKITEKETYAWVDEKLEKMVNEMTEDMVDEIVDECIEQEEDKKNKETFFYYSISKNVFKTTACMHMDLYLEKMEELYKQKIERDSLEKENMNLDKETFDLDEKLDRMFDLV